MQRVLTLALSLVAVAALAAPVLAATPVTVPADARWVSTGISVTAGEPVSIRTLGYVQTAKIPAFHVPGEFKSASDAAGQTDNPTCGQTAAGFTPEVLAITGPCVLDDAYFGTLIGRVGDAVFAIGRTDTLVAPASGVLELAVNDLANTYGDNRGTFTVLFP